MNRLGYEGDPPFNYEFGNEWKYNSPFICVFIALFLFEHENNLPLYSYMRLDHSKSSTSFPVNYSLVILSFFDTYLNSYRYFVVK
jgi:hypothetical protein